MASKFIQTRWLTAPLALLFLLFSSGAAAAPECHVQSVVQPAGQSQVVDGHSAHTHTHAPQITANAASNFQGTLLSVGSTLTGEICVVIGFVVLLLLRFSRAFRSMPTTKQFSLPRFQLSLAQSKNLAYLNLNHIQLGIIRI